MAGVFDNTTVSRVQQANDIVDIIGEYVSLKKKGREMVGICPFHDDHRPSLNVNPVKQIYKCFACGAGGDVFKFLQMLEGLSFPQAIERLAQRANIEIKYQPKPKDKTQTPQIDPARLARANSWAADHFHANLLDEQKGRLAREYLEKRKISLDVAKKWQIGLALGNDDLANTAHQKKANLDMLKNAGLLTAQHNDRFENRLMFPITDVTGRVIGFGGRTLDDTGAKYINSPATALFDKSNCIYGLRQARHTIVSSGTAIVVEGYTDCIMSHTMGITNVVATLGTSFTSGHARILRRYAKKVVLIFDSDAAGIEAANRALEVCISQHIDIKLATVPGQKDPCDFLIAAGKQKFQLLIDKAIDVFEFKWSRLTENLNKNATIAERKAAVEEFLQTIANAMQTQAISPIERGLIVNRLSSIIGIENKQINSELDRLLKRAKKVPADNLQNKNLASRDLGQGGFAAAQRQILEVLLNRPDLFISAEKHITPELFDVPILKQIAHILFELLKQRPQTTLAEILTRTDSVQLSSIIIELEQEGGKKGNLQSCLDGALKVVERYKAMKKRDQLSKDEDKTKLLKQVFENSRKQNSHNIGML